MDLDLNRLSTVAVMSLITKYYLNMLECKLSIIYTYLETRLFTRCVRRLTLLTHCGRVTQICVFNTVKPGTSVSSP
jgi:hypothetical protein